MTRETCQASYSPSNRGPSTYWAAGMLARSNGPKPTVAFQSRLESSLAREQWPLAGSYSGSAAMRRSCGPHPSLSSSLSSPLARPCSWPLPSCNGHSGNGSSDIRLPFVGCLTCVADVPSWEERGSPRRPGTCGMSHCLGTGPPAKCASAFDIPYIALHAIIASALRLSYWRSSVCKIFWCGTRQMLSHIIGIRNSSPTLCVSLSSLSNTTSILQWYSPLTLFSQALGSTLFFFFPPSHLPRKRGRVLTLFHFWHHEDRNRRN
jgi:hypothetical protein